MTSAEFVGTFELRVFRNRSLRRAAAAAICGRHADACVFSLGQGHANLSGAVLWVKPRWGSTESCHYFLCDRRELNYLGEGGTGQIRSRGCTAPERNFDCEQQNSKVPVMFSCCQCNAEADVLLPPRIVYFEHVSAVL